MSETQTAPKTAPLSLTIDMQVYPAQGQSLSEAVKDLRQRITEYLTQEGYPLWEDYGVSVESIQEAEEAGEPLVWIGYEGPFITEVSVR